MTLYERFAQVLRLKPDYIQMESGASYFVERQGTKLHIYFEWSNGFRDWFHNLNFFATPYRKMDSKWFVHRGFLKRWKEIEPHLKNQICDLDVTEIEITGYSHGAALALLCYEYCQYNRVDLKYDIHGYGYGCPRVLWGVIPKEVKARLEGFVVIRNDSDIVTHVPPKVLGFRHVGRVVLVGEGKKYNAFVAHDEDNYLKELKAYYEEDDHESKSA